MSESYLQSRSSTLCPKGNLRVWLDEKERVCVCVGGGAAVKISVTAVIVADLSKMALVWFTQCASPLLCRLSYGVAVACLSLLAVLC